jgi:hypothetical protein
LKTKWSARKFIPAPPAQVKKLFQLNTLERSI